MVKRVTSKWPTQYVDDEIKKTLRFFAYCFYFGRPLGLTMSERQAIPERPPAPKSSSIIRFIRYEHLVAGVSGGVTSTLVLHPLDLIKIRFQGEFFPQAIFILS